MENNLENIQTKKHPTFIKSFLLSIISGLILAGIFFGGAYLCSNYKMGLEKDLFLYGSGLMLFGTIIRTFYVLRHVKCPECGIEVPAKAIRGQWICCCSNCKINWDLGVQNDA